MSNNPFAIDGDGFAQAMSPALARRQFKISLGLVGVVALATSLLLGVGAMKPRYAEPATVKLVIQSPGALKVQQATVTPTPGS